MINVNNKNKMHRQEQIIELSDHVKNKIKQHQVLSTSSLFNNSLEGLVESDMTDDDNDSVLVTSADNIIRPRRDTFTTFQVKQPSESFRPPDKNHNHSVVQDKYSKQGECQECVHRDHIIHFERQRLLRLYEENKKLHEQLQAAVVLNREHENDIQKLKTHLGKVNSHLYEYHINFDQLKQKIVVEEETSPKIEEEEEEEDEEQQQDTTSDHIKRLRYEVEMYNRIVAAKQKQEEKHESFD